MNDALDGPVNTVPLGTEIPMLEVVVVVNPNVLHALCQINLDTRPRN